MILVVDDEPDLAELMRLNLTRNGQHVRVVHGGLEALRVAAQQTPELVLLDAMLPDIPGTEVCRRLRMEPATCAVPVIMVTARGEEIDRVVGFEAGVDDYVVKPFSVRELMLRCKAVMRRAKPTPTRLEHGRLAIDSSAHRAYVDGRPVELQRREFQLLSALLEARGRVRTRADLLRDVWSDGSGHDGRAVDAAVKRLRRQLGEARDQVQTLRGVGYRLAPAG